MEDVRIEVRMEWVAGQVVTPGVFDKSCQLLQHINFGLTQPHPKLMLLLVRVLVAQSDKILLMVSSRTIGL